jgi:hypothetical protein
LLIAIMHQILGADDPYGIAAKLMAAAVPSGSYLAFSRPASDIDPHAELEESGG